VVLGRSEASLNGYLLQLEEDVEVVCTAVTYRAAGLLRAQPAQERFRGGFAGSEITNACNDLPLLYECQRGGLAFFPAESFRMNNLEESNECCTPFEGSGRISKSANLLKRWSGRPGSNRRRPAWESGRGL
jgi:hypothetical protein